MSCEPTAAYQLTWIWFGISTASAMLLGLFGWSIQRKIRRMRQLLERLNAVQETRRVKR